MPLAAGVGAQGLTWQDVPPPQQERITPPVAPPSEFAFVGSFTDPTISGEFIDVLDIDNDADNDLIVAEKAGTDITVTSYRGAGGSYTIWDSVTVADGRDADLTLVGHLNGDGHADVVVATTSGFSVILGSGSGFGVPVGYAGSFIELLADIDGDGDQDILGQNEYFANDGNGSFAPAGPAPEADVAADLDGDGLIDLIEIVPEGYPGLEVASVRPGSGGGSFGSPIEAWISLDAQHSTAVFVGDRDQDGRLEIYLPTDREWRAGEHLYELVTAEDDGAGYASTTTDLEGGQGIAGWVHDVDADGDRDVVVLQASQIVVDETTAGGSVRNTYAASFVSVGTPRLADFDADGVVDVVAITTTGIVYALGVGATTPDGTLTMDYGVSGICVEVLQAGSGLFTSVAGETGANGTVTFSLPSGHYDVFSWDCAHEDGGALVRHPFSWWTARADDGSQTGPGVLVNPGSTTTVDVSLPLGAIYTGTVTDIRSGAAIARITVGEAGGGFTSTTTDDSGGWSWVGVPEKTVPSFSFDDLEGFYFSDDQSGPTATIGAVFTVDQALDGRLVDARDSIFAQDILWIADAGITAGCAQQGYLYCPGDSISRGQMAAFLVRAKGLTDIDPSVTFDDIDGNIFENDIKKLATAGITTGCKGGTSFCPGDPVTRGQMAAFLVRAFGFSDIDPTISFDDTANSIFEQDILKLATAEVTFGCKGGANFCPADPVKRGQMAAFLRRALEQ